MTAYQIQMITVVVLLCVISFMIGMLVGGTILAIKCRGVVEDNPNLDEILWGYRKEDVDEFFDNLVKEMVGDAE